MTIQWFPGHMNRARREIGRAMRETDVVVEVLDARLPRASANPMLRELRRDLPCLAVLNKADLADPVVTDAWLEALERNPARRAVAVSAERPRDLRAVASRARELAPGRGRPGRRVRLLVVGIPNVGKSTLINGLAGRRIARVEDRPAVTRQAQPVHLEGGLSLVDTPGVLWPKLDDPEGALCLAASGAIRDAVLEVESVARFAIDLLRRRYPGRLAERYGVDEREVDPAVGLAGIARRRGCLSKGGALDLERAAEIVLRELRGGALGRVSLEEPGAPGD